MTTSLHLSGGAFILAIVCSIVLRLLRESFLTADNGQIIKAGGAPVTKGRVFCLLEPEYCR